MRITTDVISTNIFKHQKEKEKIIEIDYSENGGLYIFMNDRKETVFSITTENLERIGLEFIGVENER